MNRIVISYRRQDSADVTGRIYDRLVSEFGRDNVFKDVDTIPAGVDFRQEIGKAVGQSAVFLAVIGDRWLTMPDEDGRRRIDNPNDFVRVEVETALRRDIRVIPVLVRGAIVPSEAELPEAMRALTFLNAIPVRNDPDFHHDVDRLIKSIRDVIRPACAVIDPAHKGASLPTTDKITAQARLMRHSIPEIEEEMKRRLIGQELAVDRIMPWIKRLRFGLPRNDRPAAVFAFIGQSGIGKTVFAKELARVIFGADDRLVFFQMGQFTGPTAVSSLIGAPEGFVGYGEGQLVNAVRDSAQRVFFFDEIEKADTRVIDLLLRFADEGVVQDSAGASRDGRTAVVIFATNLPFSAISEGTETGDRDQLVKAMISAGLRPEIIGRMDEVICFLPLSRVGARKLVDIVIGREVLGLKDARGVRLSVDEAARDLIADDFYELSLHDGARSARRVVHNRLVVPVIDFVFEQESEKVEPRLWDLSAVVDACDQIAIVWTDQGAQIDAQQPAGADDEDATAQ